MIDESIVDPDPTARRELLEALALAFRDNPMNVAIHGSNPRRRVRANRAGLRALVLDSADQAIARVIRHEDRVVGGFIVVPPGGFPIARQKLGRQIGCLIGQGARAMDRWSSVTAYLGLYHPDTDHWYLAVLGIVPWLRGYGFGSRLIEALGRITESNPCPLYLESDREASMRFYLARGFALRDEIELQGVRCWCLGRGFAGIDRDLCDSVRES
jgi:ribosomal protein S18 acetylase RimI-like enzyme